MKMDRLLRKYASSMGDWMVGMRTATVSLQTTLPHGNTGKAELLVLRVVMGGEREWILFPCSSYVT